jgi:hypothetical protein
LPDLRQSKDSVGKYYDANTRRFLRLGHGSKALSIHRAVWGEGVRTREDAMHYVHELILDEARTRVTDFVLDLGCGVGGSILYLAGKIPARFVGVTLSRVQADLGMQLIERRNLGGRCRILQGNFLDESFYRLSVPRTQKRTLVYGIESFIHSRDMDGFFAAVSKVLNEADRLVLCDDFLMCDDFLKKSLPRETVQDNSVGSPAYCDSSMRGNASGKEGQWLADFKSGWKAECLVSLDRAVESAARHGFVEVRRMDLTSKLELDRPRDLFIRALVSLGRLLPIRGSYWDNLRGGNALQLCLKAGLIGYWFIVLERSSV